MSENKLSLNQKIEELDGQVEWFYSDEFKLDEATDKYKQAVKLAKEIEKVHGKKKYKSNKVRGLENIEIL